MISRRRFLQCLLAIPAIAYAAPQLVEAMAAPVESEPLGGTWLMFDGKVVECISLSINQRNNYIETMQEGWEAPRPMLGLTDFDMEVELAGLYRMHGGHGGPISIEVICPQGSIKTIGYVRSIVHECQVASIMRSTLLISLVQVEYRA